MDDFEEELLEKYFVDELPEYLVLEEAFHLLLLILGEKDSALVMSADKDEVKLVKDFCRDFSLDIKVVEGSSRSLIDKLLGRDTRFDKDEVFVCRDSKRFELIDENDLTSEDIGKFLEYPEEAVEYYLDKDMPAKRFKEEFNTDLEGSEYLNLVSFVPAPNTESVEKAIEQGRQREQSIKQIEERTSLSLSSLYLEPLKNFEQP